MSPWLFWLLVGLGVAAVLAVNFVLFAFYFVTHVGISE